MAIGNNEETLEEHCLCGVHVHTGTKIVVLIEIVFKILSVLLVLFLLSSFMNTSPNKIESNNGKTNVSEQNYQLRITNSDIYIFFSVIFIFACVFLLYGVSKRRPGFYWPYLVFMTIWLIYFILFVIAFTVITVLYFCVLIGNSEKDRNIGDGMFLLVVNVMSILLFVANFYFGFVVVRRSNALLDAEVYGPSPVVQPHQLSVYQSEAQNKV